MIMDSLGVGAMPDAASYGDEGSNTLGHILREVPSLDLPEMMKLGLGEIEGIPSRGKMDRPTGAFGRMAERSIGKDTITGHWEIAGLITETPFQTFTDTGFPESFIHAFEQRIGVKVLGNYSASGTDIIEELGPEQRRTGRPIVYTSADSVFQIAADTDVIPLEKLYEMCGTAREMLQGDLLVGRVIARPYVYHDGVYTRTSQRKDYAVAPPAPTMLDHLSEKGHPVFSVGKISDIFCGRGIHSSIHTKDNNDGIDQTLRSMDQCQHGLIFTNLVDFDARFGHRRDPRGYGNALGEFDQRIPEIIQRMKKDDILILTADHGNDPVHTGWNHTREYVPLLVAGERICPGTSLGTRSSFADVSASICDYLEAGPFGPGTSFMKEVEK